MCSEFSFIKTVEERNTAPFSFANTPVLLTYLIKLNVLQLHAFFTCNAFFQLNLGVV